MAVAFGHLNCLMPHYLLNLHLGHVGTGQGTPSAVPKVMKPEVLNPSLFNLFF